MGSVDIKVYQNNVFFFFFWHAVPMCNLYIAISRASSRNKQLLTDTSHYFVDIYICFVEICNLFLCFSLLRNFSFSSLEHASRYGLFALVHLLPSFNTRKSGKCSRDDNVRYFIAWQPVSCFVC